MPHHLQNSIDHFSFQGLRYTFRKFHKIYLQLFEIILLTDQPTNKQTETKHILLIGTTCKLM